MKKLVFVVMVVIGLMLVGCENPESTTNPENITLIGTWTKNNFKVNNRTVNETLIYNSDGTYSVEGRYADTNDLVANNSGTFTYTSDTITYTTDPNNLEIETYVIDAVSRTLTITTSTPSVLVWTRK